MKIRPATREDFRAFYGKTPPMSLRAVVGERNAGDIVGIGGYYLSKGHAVAFVDHRGATKKEMVIGGRAVMELIEQFGGTVYATNESGDSRALRHFGFVEHGPVWRYERI